MTKIGIIGTGTISGIYLKSPTVFPILEMVACADLELARAQAKAEEYKIEALSVADLLAHPEIEIVINLTIPAAHAEVAQAAIAHGKSVYSEKPLALNTTDGKAIIDAAIKLPCIDSFTTALNPSGMRAGRVEKGKCAPHQDAADRE